MHNNLYVILILILTIYHIHVCLSNPSHCLIHIRRHQPSIGHYLLRIEHSINNEQACERRCSIDRSCAMATFNRRFHRCHLFQHHHPKHSLHHPYRSNHIFTTFANCHRSFSLSNTGQTGVSTVHCNYDSYVLTYILLFYLISFLNRLPWQRAQRSRSIIFQSYTLIGISYLPCQELWSSVRQCAAVQYQVNSYFILFD